MTRSPLILVGPEDPTRLLSIANNLAPRLDYRLVAAHCQGAIREWQPSPAGLRGHRRSRLVRSFLGNLGNAVRWLPPLPPGSLIYSTGETWGLPVALVGALLPRRHFKHIVYVHRVFSPRWLRFLRVTKNLLAVDGWICVTRYQANLLKSILGPECAPVMVISQGVDTVFFDPTKAMLSKQQPYILAVGAEMRNYDLLFAAVRNLNIKVIVKSSSAWMADGRTELTSVPPNAMVITEQLSYLELRNLYAGAMLVVAPLYETPQAAGITTIMEAMAMGRCVLATQSSGLPDALLNKGTGVVVPQSIDDLREAVLVLSESPDIRQVIAGEGQRFVRTHHKIEDHATAVSKFLTEIAVT